MLLLCVLGGQWWARGAAYAQGVSAAGPREPAEYAAALAKLEAGDTLGALEDLRSLTKARPDFGPAFLRLGALLSARAGEAPKNYPERREAQKALERATRLMPNDPVALLEYGLLLKRQSMNTDAKRVLERAWAAAERMGEGLAARDRARLHFELGKVYEAWWEDWHNLVAIPPTAQGLLHCPAATPAGAGEGEIPLISHWMAAVACPREWAEQAERVVPLEDLKSEERARMMEHFRLALEADPGHVEAAIRLLGHLADAGEWGEYERVAERLVAAAPEDARSHLFRGLGLHETGRDEAADSVFRRALALMDPRERAAFEDITLLLPRRLHERYAALDSAGREATARVFFTATDPLFLTGAEERRLEHYARLAWAELKFGVPERGVRGWQTEAGQIWVRYGKPWKWYQCCYGGSGSSGGWMGDNDRYMYWSYGLDGPVFVFRRRLTYRHARLVEPAKELADELAAQSPELYRLRTVTTVHGVPHQVVRFRGRDPEATLVEIHAEPPLDSLGAARGDRLAAGIFLFGPDYQPVWSRLHEVEIGDLPVMLTYRLEVGPGRYRYAVEARVTGPDSVPRPAARAREMLEVPGFAGAGVALSDLLLADALVPLADAPSSRQELRIVPSRTLAFEQGAPVHLYFEVYGLQPDEEGYGSYRAELAVEDSTRRNLVQRLARGARELFRGGAGDQRVSWERTAPVRDGVVIDYLTVELPALEAGEYVVRVRVREAGSGEEAEAVRRFRVVAPRTPDGGG